MLTLEHIGITFNAHTPDENNALKDINVRINKGDFITVIGSNGAGKSTLYNVIAGTLQPTAGRILLDREENGNAKDITKDAEFKRARFREQLSVLNMGLEDRLSDNVDQFSGGQRQALTLLMAVMSKPDLLLLDEHTAALDPTNAEIIMQLTLRFAREYGLTVMMVTHNMQHALDYGNRLLMMDSGDILLDIDAEEKAKLTMDALIQRFRAIKNVTNDNMLLQ